MILNTMKKIYIIGTNPTDPYDCTIQAIEKIKKSELLILPPKFDNNFINLIKNKKIIYLQENLSKKNNIYLWKKILIFFERYNVIGHLVDGDPFIDQNGVEESNFFWDRNIESEIIPGIINLVNRLNKNSKLLTDREKNSSVTFMKPFNLKKFSKIIKNSFFEKLIIYLESENDINEIRYFLSKNILNLKISFTFKDKNIILTQPDINFVSKFSCPCYIIFEKNEKL